MPNVFTPNVLCANPNYAIFELKAALKAQGWTVPKSSDGTTYNSSGDQITSGGTGAGGMGNASAWFVIRDPGGAKSYLFQNYFSTYYAWYAAYSTAAGFVGGSPSATVTPTATDQQSVMGSSIAAPGNFFNNITTTPLYMHFCVDSSAPYTWYAMGFIQGSGVFTFFMAQDSIVTTTAAPSDTNLTIVEAANFNVSGTWFVPDAGGFTVSGNITPDLGGAWGYYKYGLGGEAYVSYAIIPPRYSSGVILPTNLGTNPYETKIDLMPALIARTGANASLKGVSVLHKLTGTLQSNLDTLSVSSARDRVTVRAHSLPWGGAVPLI